MLSINPCPTLQRKGKGGKGTETYKLNIKSFTNNTNNKRNNVKYTKPIWSFPEMGAGQWRPASSCRGAPGSPELASAVGRNWAQGCTDRNLEEDRR